jgi:Ca-activated chloride channel family protein
MSINFRCSCNRAGVPVLNTPQLVYLFLELFQEQAVQNVRLPLNFVLVLDRSGSMEGQKLETMKQAVNQIINQLEPNDVISVITFESSTQVIIPAQGANNKNEMMRKIDRITDGGATNMATALHHALQQVQQYLLPDRTSRIVLLTDGEATDNEDASRALSDQAGAMGVPIIGLGFGNQWNEDFMIDLIDRSVMAQPGSNSGVVFQITSPEYALEIFQKMFKSMQIVAQDTQCIVRMVQGMEARKVWQVVPLIKDISSTTIQGRAVSIPVGQMEQNGAAFLVELMVPPRQAGNFRIAQAEVMYTLPGQAMQRDQSDVILQFTNDQYLSNQLDGRVMNIVEKVQAHKLQTQALSDAESGNTSGATRKLRAAVTILLGQGENEMAAQMQQEADRLEQGGQISNEGKKTIKLKSRETVRLSDIE